MDLKEHIKALVREMLNEEGEGMGGNTTAAVPGYLTPKAFAPKGQKKNAATKAAEKQGWKPAKGIKPKQVVQVKQLWPGKKSAMQEAIGSKFQIGASYTIDGKGDYDYKGVDKGTDKFKFEDPSSKKIIYINPDDSKDIERVKQLHENKMKLNDIIDQELLSEVTYHKFKNEVKYRTKAEMLHKSIREVKRKLAEVDQLIEYTTRIKQELSENEESTSYWKRSLKAINEISEMSNKISNKIKSIYQ